MSRALFLTKDQRDYLRALVDAECDFDEESRHLSEECSEPRDSAQAKLHAPGVDPIEQLLRDVLAYIDADEGAAAIALRQRIAAVLS